MDRLIYILLPVHNRREVTLGFIRCLKEQTYTNFKLVLIDDGSTDGTSEKVVSKLPGTVAIKGKGNWWWAGSLHEGYRWLKRIAPRKEDMVLIMNDDCRIDKDFLQTGARLLEEHPNTFFTGRARDGVTGEVVDGGLHYNFKKNTFEITTIAGKINCLSTRGLFMPAPAFIALGGFYPFLLPHYLSDYEFSIRAWRKGIRLMSFPEPVLISDMKTTGLHKITSLRWKDFRKQYFSRRYVENPFYQISFYLLAFPFPYNCRHVLKKAGEITKVLMNVAKYNVKLLIK